MKNRRANSAIESCCSGGNILQRSPACAGAADHLEQHGEPTSGAMVMSRSEKEIAGAIAKPNGCAQAVVNVNRSAIKQGRL
jgi:hypothetical protein